MVNVKPADSNITFASKLAHPFNVSTNMGKIMIFSLVLAIITGAGTGYFLTTKATKGSTLQGGIINQPPKNASQDIGTFRDFAEGTIKLKPTPKNGIIYSEGTHILERDYETPVALTSSVVDLSQYEGKRVKVYGETQKALKEGWLMDVGRVEEIE